VKASIVMEDANNNIDQEELLLAQLKDILLKEERADLADAKNIVEDPEKLSEKISPILEEHFALLKKKFPKEYNHIIDKMIEQKLERSQKQLVALIAPQLGPIIKKSITHQFQKLKENIDEQVNKVKKPFTKEGLFGRFSRKKKKYGESDIILSSLDKPIIEEIYVIQRNSGLLIGSASLKEIIDQDVIAGMLTAIKSFVEDAFQQEKEELEMIQYGTYHIFIQNFYSYYIAVAMSGSISATEKEDLSNRLYTFAENEISKTDLTEIADTTTKKISSKLEEFFILPYKVKLNATKA